ncbi:MAG: secreted hydrolase-like protein [Proteobacteria bacterium]|nr:secreted hydrolase-like protein [Pseudomonadota bacterium]
MSRRFGWWIGGLLAALIIGLIGYRLLQSAPQPVRSVTVGSALGGDDNAGYQRAYAPRPFELPADHGPHPEFRNEWWYVTGNLADAADRQFGYQLTLFRIALSPTAPPADSPASSVSVGPRWVWRAHKRPRFGSGWMTGR